MVKVELIGENKLVFETRDTSKEGLDTLDMIYQLIMKNIPTAKGGYKGSAVFEVDI